MHWQAGEDEYSNSAEAACLAASRLQAHEQRGCLQATCKTLAGKHGWHTTTRYRVQLAAASACCLCIAVITLSMGEHGVSDKAGRMMSTAAATISASTIRSSEVLRSRLVILAEGNAERTATRASFMTSLASDDACVCV